MVIDHVDGKYRVQSIESFEVHHTQGILKTGVEKQEFDLLLHFEIF